MKILVPLPADTRPTLPIITLTTDFGEKDPFVGAVKGAIYSELPDQRIVDITHSVSPFNLVEAAYVIKNAYRSFPKGSIHIIGIDAESTSEMCHIAVQMDEHYFICADNGILSLITSDLHPQKMVEIKLPQQVNSNFPVRDVFVKVAAHLARGGKLEVIGKPIEGLKELTGIKPVINPTGDQILGSVLYIDNYGNVVTNITQNLIIQQSKGRSYSVFARNYRFNKVFKRYSEAINFDLPREKREEEGKKLALFNSAGYLELAIYKSNPLTVGGASSLFGLSFRDSVTVNFE